MKKIPLTKGQTAIVCDCHFHLVEGYKWHAQFDWKKCQFYAVRNATKKERESGSATIILMHRVINNTPDGMETDHIQGDTLDNRCDKLRSATHSQNMMNRKKQSNNTSGFRGVYYNKQMGKWRARIKNNGTLKDLGTYDSAEQAGKVYADAARELHGEFAGR